MVTPTGGGVSQAEAEKTRAMLRRRRQWGAGRRDKVVPLVLNVNEAAADLSDIDRIHRMIATNNLADICTRLAGGQEG